MPIYLEESDERELDGKLDHNMSTVFSPSLRKNLNVIQALKGNLLLWADEDASDAEKAVALCWILHLVGDMHQPLHVGNKEDIGGNAIIVFTSATDQNANTKLHAVWALSSGDNNLAILLRREIFECPRLSYLTYRLGVMSSDLHTSCVIDTHLLAGDEGRRLAIKTIPNRQFPDYLRIQGNRITVLPPKELHSFRGHQSARSALPERKR